MAPSSIWFGRRRRLLAKLRRHAPDLVARVGITVFRELAGGRGAVAVGPQVEPIAGRPCWVLPKPSVRDAHFTYPETLDALVRLRRRAAAPDLLGEGAGGRALRPRRPDVSGARPGIRGTRTGSR